MLADVLLGVTVAAPVPGPSLYTWARMSVSPAPRPLAFLTAELESLKQQGLYARSACSTARRWDDRKH